MLNSERGAVNEPLTSGPSAAATKHRSPGVVPKRGPQARVPKRALPKRDSQAQVPKRGLQAQVPKRGKRGVQSGPQAVRSAFPSAACVQCIVRAGRQLGHLGAGKGAVVRLVSSASLRAGFGLCAELGLDCVPSSVCALSSP